MNIVAVFTDGGTPKTGLTPTIRIRLVSDNSLVVTDAAMSEIGDGAYKYDFTAYDSEIDYSVRCDGGASLNDEDRYAYGITGTSGLTPEESAALLDLQTDVEYLRGMEKGEWSIAGNQMIFKNESDVEIARFDLFDENGSPSMINVFRRTPV